MKLCLIKLSTALLVKKQPPVLISKTVRNVRFKHESRINKLLERRVTLYKFDPIHILAGLSSMKRKLIVLVSFGMPVNVLLFANNFISVYPFYTVTISVTIMLLKLYYTSKLIDGWIGFIYVYENSPKVTISYLDFHGNRVDKDFDQSDFIPLQDNRNKYRDRYYSVIKLRNNEQNFKIRFKHCALIDENIFENIFGIIPDGSY